VCVSICMFFPSFLLPFLLRHLLLSFFKSVIPPSPRILFHSSLHLSKKIGPGLFPSFSFAAGSHTHTKPHTSNTCIVRYPFVRPFLLPFNCCFRPSSSRRWCCCATHDKNESAAYNVYLPPVPPPPLRLLLLLFLLLLSSGSHSFPL